METTILANIIYDGECILIQDMSVYNPDLPVTEAKIFVTPPNYTNSYEFDYEIFKSLQITPFNLSRKELEDGVWTIKQEICPQGTFTNSKFHLRTFKTKMFLKKQIVENAQCDEKKAKELFEMLMQLDIATILVESACKKNDAYKKGISMFNEISNYVKSQEGNCNTPVPCKTC